MDKHGQNELFAVILDEFHTELEKLSQKGKRLVNSLMNTRISEHSSCKEAFAELSKITATMRGWKRTGGGEDADR